MLWDVMTILRRGHLLVLAVFIVIAVSGCGGRNWREYVGLTAPPDPSVTLRPAEPKWLLIKNPRCCDIASEPEYVWVEEDKVPTTVKSFIFGKSTLIASPDVVAKYGAAARGRAHQPPAGRGLQGGERGADGPDEPEHGGGGVEHDPHRRAQPDSDPVGDARLRRLRRHLARHHRPGRAATGSSWAPE